MSIVLHSQRAALSLAALFAVSLFVGCGRAELDRQAVRGGVFFDGVPMKTGTIRFIPEGPTKGPAAAGPIVDGFYEIAEDEGPIAGEYRVEIEQKPEMAFEIDDEAAYAKAYAQNKRNPIPPQSVPPEYNRKSTLKAVIAPAPSDNTVNFDLKMKGISPKSGTRSSTATALSS